MRAGGFVAGGEARADEGDPHAGGEEEEEGLEGCEGCEGVGGV